MRARKQSEFSNPVLIGAVTVLVAIVAVFLAYNANTGLPFVLTRQLKVDIANGAAIVPGDEVDQGGFRIGVVSDTQPIRLANGSSAAQLTLQLNQSTRGPVDSTATILPRSVLGLKYVSLRFGNSQKVFARGATMPIAQTSVPVQFDDLNTMFDAKTRPAVQNNLAGFADALAARGSALNDTIATLPPLFQHLQPVAGYLSNPHTQLSRFLTALNGLFQTVAPVSRTAAKLSGDQATTFQAISRSPSDLERTIRFSPPTLDVSAASLKVQQTFLADLATFARYMAPATAELAAALPNVNPALEAGTEVLPRTPSLDTKLQAVLAALKSLALDPGTNLAVSGLTSTVTTLNPIVRYLGPFVTVCNYFNYALGGLAEVASQPTNFGMAQRGLAVVGNSQTNGVATLGAAQPANGYLPGDSPGKLGFADAEYLHGPPYGAAIDNQGNADCEAGQRGYPVKLNYGDPRVRSLNTDNHTPGDQGPTWTGLSRVPAGETYARNPITGPQIPFNPTNP